MTLGTASVCLTVFVLNLHYHATFVPVPSWVRLIFLRHGVRLFGFCDHRTKALLDPAAIITSTAGAAAMSKKVAQVAREPSPLPQSPLLIRRPPLKRRTSLAVSVNDLRRTSDSTTDPNKALHPVPLPVAAGALTGTGRSNSYCRMIADREENGGSSAESRHVSPVCWISNTDHVITGGNDESRDLEAILHEWQLLARVLDRVFFVVCSTLMLASALLILLSPWYARTEKSI